MGRQWAVWKKSNFNKRKDCAKLEAIDMLSTGLGKKSFRPAKVTAKQKSKLINLILKPSFLWLMIII